MAEHLQEVKVFRVNYRCNECGEDLIYSGSALLMAPPLYMHYCKNEECGSLYKEVTLREKYPTLRYE